jgi:hypothetical protein
VRGRVKTVDFDLAAGGTQQSGKNLDGGCLARPVGTEEGEDLALVHVEWDIADGLDFAVSLDQMICPNHGSILNGSV